MISEKVTLKVWKNNKSLAVIIPKPIADKLKIALGEHVEAEFYGKD